MIYKNSMRKNLVIIYLILFSFTAFADSSKPLVQKECKGKNNELWNNCFFYQFYDSGKIYSKVFFKNGKIEGERFYFFENGKIQAKGSYKDGKKEGADYRYFENGKIQSKGFYRKGNIEGKSIAYDDRGNVIKEIFICEGRDTSRWTDCTGILFSHKKGIENCVFNIYMNTKIFMGINYKDVGFYVYPECEIFVGEWKNGKPQGEGKYMYWVKTNSGYSEAQYLTESLTEVRKKFNKEFK